MASEFWGKGDMDFVSVQLASGESGYIQKYYLRSPIGYRFGFSLHDNGEWKMDFMIAGD
jgi:hypothetical protein